MAATRRTRGGLEYNDYARGRQRNDRTTDSPAGGKDFA
jgi:hypothetical protein